LESCFYKRQVSFLVVKTAKCKCSIPYIQQKLVKNDSMFSFKQVICRGVARRGKWGHATWAQVLGCINTLCSKI